MNNARSTEQALSPWRDVLRFQGRSLRWLAAQTGRRERTVYAYSIGQTTPPDEWLADVSRVLGVPVGHITVEPKSAAS